MPYHEHVTLRKTCEANITTNTKSGLNPIKKNCILCLNCTLICQTVSCFEKEPFHHAKQLLAQPI